ncbi:hypothetical protein C8R46DRAFT_443723 [Mycena filopes]|nr:hypothetical protein C8R46DRAFT_443723 [Mycena filopes]
MRSIFLLFLSLVSLAVADQNTTIDDTDASIQYSDGGHTEPCAIGANGTISGGPGCFNNGPKNCSSGAHILQAKTSTLSMKFKGSAIYMNALLDDISNLYTVTLDGKSTDVDGFRPGGALLCYTLFSQTGLDPTVEHNISLSIKGASPNATSSPGGSFFWLDNFVVTTSDGNTTANATSSQSSAGSSSPSSTPTGQTRASSQISAMSVWMVLAIGLASGLLQV